MSLLANFSNEPSYANHVPQSTQKRHFLKNDVLVEIVDKINISKPKAVQAAEIVLAKRKRDATDQIVITELPDSDEEESDDDDLEVYSYTCRDSSQACFELIFSEQSPNIGLGGVLELYEGCLIWRNCLIVSMKDYRVVERGKDLSEDGLLYRVKEYVHPLYAHFVQEPTQRDP